MNEPTPTPIRSSDDLLKVEQKLREQADERLNIDLDEADFAKLRNLLMLKQVIVRKLKWAEGQAVPMADPHHTGLVAGAHALDAIRKELFASLRDGYYEGELNEFFEKLNRK